MGAWTRQDKRSLGIALIFASLAGFAVAWEAFYNGFSIAASGLTAVDVGLLSFIGLLGGAFLLAIN